MSKSDGDKKQLLKELIRELHTGANPDVIKEKFKAVLGETSPTEIAEIEEELIKEGMGREEIQRLCEVHIAVFKETLEKAEVLAPSGHPVHILQAEHTLLLKFSDELLQLAKTLRTLKDLRSAEEQLHSIDKLIECFKDSEKHYLREENVLFPYLEKHGITQPPAIMWTEHDTIREIKKKLYRLYDTQKTIGFHDFARQLEEVAASLTDMLSSHFYKEKNILLPAGLKVIEPAEWNDIKREFAEIGYCRFTPAAAIGSEAATTTGAPQAGMVNFETGTLSPVELEALLNTLPVDVTFIDNEDTVRYFSQSRDRIFVRTKAVIGRKVQQCHPQKSLHVVNRILDDFKNNRRESAEFWINLEDKLVYIRYFAVRSPQGRYLGCLEVSQDIAPLKKIEGEKKLL